MNGRPHAIDRWLTRTFVAVALFTLSYQLVAVWYAVASALAFYYAHLGLILTVIGFQLIRESRQQSEGFSQALRITYFLVAILLAVGASLYLYLNVDAIELRQPFITDADFVAGGALLAAVLMLSWRIWGGILTGLMVFAILYFVFGAWAPQPFTYSPPDPGTIMSYLTGMGGARGVLWGIPLSANTLFLIIIYGGLLKGTRILEMFNEVGKLMMNVTRGGVCYSAVAASSAIGMVTGQAVANVALSGSMTIPSMQQRGLSPEQAGAVEVVASLGSQLLPPIMGLGGFLMAVNLGVPYVDIAAAAVIPAVLYVASVLMAAFFLVEGEPNVVRVKERPDIALIFWLLPSFLLSFGALIGLLYLRYSPSYAAFWSILILIVMSFVRPGRYRPGITHLGDGTLHGVVSACQLALILAGIGIIVQVLVTTGSGFDLGRVLMQAAGGHVVAALLLGMVLSLFVGLGLPTPAAYALLAIIMIPFLIDIGVQPIVAHFFGFYFAIFSAVSPPVAVGVLTATRISHGSFYGTALEAIKLSAVCFLIPYSFVAFPSLLGFPTLTLNAAAVIVTLLFSTAGWGACVYGVLLTRLLWWERCLMLLSPIAYIVMLLTQQLWWGSGSILIFLLILLLVVKRIARTRMHQQVTVRT